METKNEKLTSSSSDLFAGIDVSGGRLVFDAAAIMPGEEGGDDTAPEYERRITVDKLKSWYSSEKMHKHMVSFLGWIGRKKGYQSLQVDPTDEDFQTAVEVLHRRIAGTAFAKLLELLGDEAVEDAILVFVGVSPVAYGLITEVVEKDKAAKLEREINHKTDKEQPDHE